MLTGAVRPVRNDDFAATGSKTLSETEETTAIKPDRRALQSFGYPGNAGRRILAFLLMKAYGCTFGRMKSPLALPSERSCKIEAASTEMFRGTLAATEAL